MLTFKYSTTKEMEKRVMKIEELKERIGMLEVEVKMTVAGK